MTTETLGCRFVGLSVLRVLHHDMRVTATNNDAEEKKTLRITLGNKFSNGMLIMNERKFLRILLHIIAA